MAENIVFLYWAETKQIVHVSYRMICSIWVNDLENAVVTKSSFCKVLFLQLQCLEKILLSGTKYFLKSLQYLPSCWLYIYISLGGEHKKLYVL